MTFERFSALWHRVFPTGRFPEHPNPAIVQEGSSERLQDALVRYSEGDESAFDVVNPPSIREQEPTRMFGLSAEEHAKLHAWQREHDVHCPKLRRQGAIGGRLTYSFTPTSLGCIVTVECACGGKVNVTDYDAF